MRILFISSLTLSLISSVAAQAASIQGGASITPLTRVGVVQMPAPIVTSVTPRPTIQGGASLPHSGLSQTITPVVINIPRPTIQGGVPLPQTVTPVVIDVHRATIQGGVSFTHIPGGALPNPGPHLPEAILHPRVIGYFSGGTFLPLTQGDSELTK